MAPDPIVLLSAICLPFAGALAVPVVYRVIGERTAYACAGIAAVCFALLASQGGTVGSVTPISWVPSMGVTLELYVDGLSLLVGGLASGVGVLIFTYSGGYMPGEPGQPKYYASLLVFMGAMLGLVLAANLVAIFLFWELTSLSSFALIGHYQRADSSLYAARKSMLVTVAGGLFLLVGFILLYVVSGSALEGGATFSLTEMIHHADAMEQALREQGLLLPVLAMVGIGAGAKSAQVPLHIWLPNAMEAPTPVSAFLHSATMVKAGVYLIGRVRPLLSTGEWQTIFVVLGLTTMTVTAVLAVAASDIKELLAYSTASHLGLIVAGFGFQAFEKADVGGETGAFHILNHATFKAALFLVAGIVAHEVGTRAIDDLGGLRRDLPITAGITVVAALGMAGVPPFNGFYSKELLFEAAYHLADHAGGLYWLVPVVAVLGSVFTFLYSIRFLMLFFGDRPDELGTVHTPPWSMRAPPLLLAGVAAVVGIGGITATFGVHVEPIESFLESVVGAVGAHGEAHFSYYLPTSAKPAAIMSGVTIGVGVVAYPFFDRLRDGIRRVLSFGPATVDWYYDATVGGLETTSSAVVDRVQTGQLRTYATWAVGAFAALTLAGYLAAGVNVPNLLGPNPGNTYSMDLVLLLSVGAAVAVALASSHIAGVLTLSIVGFMIAIFYILVSAPDLALTQLVIETLVLVIFLLVLNRLPAFYGELKRSRAIRDGALSAVVGVTVFLTVVVATSQTPGLSLRKKLVKTAGLPKGEHANHIILDHGGGANIVNVILVDFRAFDTLGEISVIAMAALSVLTLLGMRQRGETQ